LYTGISETKYKIIQGFKYLPEAACLVIDKTNTGYILGLSPSCGGTCSVNVEQVTTMARTN